MSAPIQPPTTVPPAPDPQAPVSVAGVTVVPRTAAQQKRSALYTWFTAFWLGLPGILIAAGAVSGQLATLFPKYGPSVVAVCSIMAAVGHAVRASQLQESAGGATTVNFSDPQDGGGA